MSGPCVICAGTWDEYGYEPDDSCAACGYHPDPRCRTTPSTRTDGAAVLRADIERARGNPEPIPPEWIAEVAAEDTRPARRGFLRRLIANMRRVFTHAPCHNAPDCKGMVRVEKGTRVDGIYCHACRLPGPQPDRRFT